MEIKNALIMFDALSQETRLNTYRLLVRAGPAGVAAGVLSAELGTPHNTLSFHLTHLANAGLIQSKKQGRSVIYSAEFSQMNELIAFLVKDCCHASGANIRKGSKKGCTTIELNNRC